MAEPAQEESPLGILIALGIIGIVGYLYFFGDSAGLDSHTVESTITAQANWIVGESKFCTSVPLFEPYGGKQKGYAFDFVKCDDGPSHLVKVTFWGRQEQPEYALVNWKCTREADQFMCTEQGGTPIQRPQQ